MAAGRPRGAAHSRPWRRVTAENRRRGRLAAGKRRRAHGASRGAAGPPRTGAGGPRGHLLRAHRRGRHGGAQEAAESNLSAFGRARARTPAGPSRARQAAPRRARGTPSPPPLERRRALRRNTPDGFFCGALAQGRPGTSVLYRPRVFGARQPRRRRHLERPAGRLAYHRGAPRGDELNFRRRARAPRDGYRHDHGHDHRSDHT